MTGTTVRDNLNWAARGTVEATCPACGNDDAKQVFLEAISLLPPYGKLTYVSCGACGTKIVPNHGTPDYAEAELTNFPLRFYVEQGAGIDILARPAFALARRGSVKRYLEIGCGYGFGVDVASRVFGWEARGIDPSPFASRGARDLGIRIDSMHLGPGTEKQVGTFDAIVAMEVIEHISDPVPLLQTLKAHLSPGGAIYMSTPNAKVAEDRHHPVLVPALSPGYHVTIFSRDGLEIAIRRAGFDNVMVVETSTSLLASATTGGAAVDVDQDVDRDQYYAYLRGRMALHEPGSPLWTGFAYRLYRDLVNSGDYEAAEPVFELLNATLFNARGIDLGNPRSITAEAAGAEAHLDSGRWPFCLTGLLYLRGIQLINTDWSPGPPLPYFLAALDAGNQIRSKLLTRGVDDGELHGQLQAAGKTLQMCLDRLNAR